MLYISLVCSGLILVAVLLAARYAKHPVPAAVLWAAGLTFLPVMVTFVFPAVWLQSAIFVAGLLAAAAFGRGRRALVPLAVLAPLAAYAVVGWHVTADYRQEEERRERLLASYPFESVEGRLARPVPASAPGDPHLLARLEQAVDRESNPGRSSSLRRLHENTVNQFVNSPGFGVARLHPAPVPEVPDDPRPDAPPQGDYLHPHLVGADRPAGRPDPAALGRLHEGGFLDFVNPRGFGYVRDRRHVAGFRSHGFGRMPGPVEKWEVSRLELVGLLRHEQPVAYVSAKLPRMDELKEAPTRPLDAFEAAALGKLRGGADLHVGDGGDAARFLGAVRSTRQCVECHGGERGALLGAFSYRLRPAD